MGSSDQLHVFKIDDGAEHWVVARHWSDAIRLTAKAYGFEDVETYLRDQEPDVSRLDPTEYVRVTLDVSVPREVYASELVGLPDSTRVECCVVAHVRAGDMADLGEPGVFCSSEW